MAYCPPWQSVAYTPMFFQRWWGTLCENRSINKVIFFSRPVIHPVISNPFYYRVRKCSTLLNQLRKTSANMRSGFHLRDRVRCSLVIWSRTATSVLWSQDKPCSSQQVHLYKFILQKKAGWRYSGLVFSAPASASSFPGSSSGWGHCVVFFGKALYSHSVSLHPGV